MNTQGKIQANTETIDGRLRDAKEEIYSLKLDRNIEAKILSLIDEAMEESDSIYRLAEELEDTDYLKSQVQELEEELEELSEQPDYTGEMEGIEEIKYFAPNMLDNELFETIKLILGANIPLNKITTHLQSTFLTTV